MKKILALVIILLSLAGCKEKELEQVEWETQESLIVASKRVIGWVPNLEPRVADSLYAVKTNLTDPFWSPFSSKIQGFDYEPGYEYVLALTVHHVQISDGSSIFIYDKKYRVKEIQSKKKRESANLPPDFF